MILRCCRYGPWMMALLFALVARSAASANLLVNGSFETGPAPGVMMQLNVGSTAIPGWVVTRTSIDYVGTAWTAAEGFRSIALNGASAGGIAQIISTIPLAQYTVRCYMTGDPGSTPVIKQMRVAAAGQSVDFTADISGMWAWDPGWNPHVWSFTANATSTAIEFYSLMSGTTGPTLDSVTVALTSTADVGSGGPLAFALGSFVPNPMRSAGQVEFTLPEGMNARVSVFDLAGREVAVLADGAFPAGRNHASWDGRTARGRASAGLYYVQLSAPGRRVAQRLVVLR